MPTWSRRQSTAPMSAFWNKRTDGRTSARPTITWAGRRSPLCFPANPTPPARAWPTVESLFAHIYREASVTKHAPLITIPFESRLEVVAEPKEDGRWFQVRLPDDRAGWVQAGDITLEPKRLTIAETLEFSKRFLGLPYTWGGTSSYGYDCSGFSQMLGRRRGLSLPRDAQPQAEWSGAVAVRAQGSAARRPAVLRRVREEDHPHRHLHGRREIHQRHHARDPDGAHRRSERRLLEQTAGGREETEMNRRKFLKTAAVAPAAGSRGAGRARRRRRQPHHQDRAAEPAAHLDDHHVVQPVPRHAAHHVHPRRDHRDTAKARRSCATTRMPRAPRRPSRACANCWSAPTRCSLPRSWPRSSSACPASGRARRRSISP